MKPPLSEKELKVENHNLKQQLTEYKELIHAIKNGEVDALAIYKNGQPNIFSLETNDFVYRVLVENFAESALNVTDKGMIIYANPAFEALLGVDHSTIIGSNISTLIDQKDKYKFETLFKDAFSGKSKGEINLTYKGKKTQVYISLSSLYPRFPGIGILITDLSEKKHQEKEISNYKSKLSATEAELLQSEIIQVSTEKFRVMADILPHKVWTADSSGLIDYFNKRWLDYTKLPFDESKGFGWKKNIHPDDWTETENIWKQSIKSGDTFELEHRLLKHDGTYRWYRCRCIPQTDAEGNVFMWVGTHTDIDDQKNATNLLEQKILERTSFLQQVLDSSVELITTYDLDLKYTSVNKTALEFMNLELKDVLGKHVLEVYPELAETIHYSYLQQTLTGDIVHKTNINGIFKEGLTFESYFKPLIVNNEIRGVLVMARNITDILSSGEQLKQKNAELKSKNLELVLSNTELASFSYIASHDLQEPLRKIQTFIDRILIKQGDQFSHETTDYLQRIISAANRMRSLLDALLRYYKASDIESEMVTTSLDSILEDVLKELAVSIHANKATFECGKLPDLKVLPLQVHKVFSNIISNAIKFRKKDVAPHITVNAVLIPEEDIEKEAALPRGKYWRISISDNGIGFNNTYEYKIFELFQKLHPESNYPGTGIGLSLSQKIAQGHNGLIKAEGLIGEGATFKIYLPLIN